MASSKCSQCGEKLPPPRGSGRPRTKCETCSPPRARDVRRRAPHKLAAVEPLSDVAPAAPSASLSVYATTRARLEAADLLDDPSATAALVLAEQLDLRSDSGASLAALARTHAILVTEVMSRAKVEADPVERLLRVVSDKVGGA